MTTPWGNDDRGPGGDPSWLGGKDRGGNSGGGGSSGSGWSSDFGSDFGPDASRSTGGGGDFGGSPAPTFGQDSRAEHAGPEFGTRAGQAPLPSRDQQGSGWKATFTGADAESAGAEGSGAGRKAISLVFRILFLGVFFIVALRIVFGNEIASLSDGSFFSSGGGILGGTSNFFKLWILLFIGIPVVRIVRKMLRKKP